MSGLESLAKLQQQLRSYEEGARLKVEAMREVQQTIDSLQLSQRAFIEKARRLGYSLPSAQSLGNWIKCTHIPTPANVDCLLEALRLMLREYGHDSTPWQAALRESSFSHAHALEMLQRDVQNLEYAIQLFNTTLAWLDLAEFPPGGHVAAFLPMTREQGMQYLDIIRQVHLAQAEVCPCPRAVEHELLAAKAAIVLSPYLVMTGHYTDALATADEGSYLLEDILTRHPQWAEMPITDTSNQFGSNIDLAGLWVLGPNRKANALHSLSYLAKSTSDRQKYQEMAQRTLFHARQVSGRLSGDSSMAADTWRTAAVFGLDGQHTQAEVEKALGDARAAQIHAQDAGPRNSAGAVLHYLSKVTEAEALSHLGRLDRANAEISQAEALELELTSRHRLHLGPNHKIVRLRALAAHWWAHARNESSGSARWREYAYRWRDAIAEARKLANQSGLYNQERRLTRFTGHAGPEFRRILAGDTP